MVLITDIVFQFITTEFVPRIVTKTVELHNNGSSPEAIIKEICASDFSTETSKVSTKRSGSSKPASKAVTKVEPKTLEEFKEAYTENYTDFQICTHVFTRGGEKLKGKICCNPVDMSIFNKDDKKTRRCNTHKDAESRVDIDSLLRSQTPSKKDQVERTRKMFPKGSPEVLNSGSATATPASASSTPNSSVISAGSGLGKITNSVSIKDQLAKKTISIEDKSSTKDSEKETTPVKTEPSKKKFPSLPKKMETKDSTQKEKTPTPVKERASTPVKERTPTPVKERTPTPVKEQTPEKERTPSPARSATPSFAQTPASRKEESVHSRTSSDHESTPDTKASVPLDENGEEYILTPSQPSAEKYLWMLYSDHEVLVFSEDFLNCYGVYRSEDKINPKKNLKISSAWKRLLKTLNTLQESFVTERGIEIKKLD